MQGLAVLLLCVGTWLTYTGGKSLRPIVTAQAVLKDPGNAGTIIKGGADYAKAHGAPPLVDLSGVANALASGAAGLATDLSSGAIEGINSGIGNFALSNIGSNPFSAYPVTAPFGQVSHSGTFGAPHVHQGVDYGMSSGTQVPAVIAGHAYHTSSSLGGNILRIDGTGPFAGWQTYYDHVKSFSVPDGAPVLPGFIVALSGGGANDPGKGDATGPHLHFEVHHNGAVVNPPTLFTWERANIGNIKASIGTK